MQSQFWRIPISEKKNEGLSHSWLKISFWWLFPLWQTNFNFILEVISDTSFWLLSAKSFLNSVKAARSKYVYVWRALLHFSQYRRGYTINKNCLFTQMNNVDENMFCGMWVFESFTVMNNFLYHAALLFALYKRNSWPFCKKMVNFDSRKWKSVNLTSNPSLANEWTKQNKTLMLFYSHLFWMPLSLVILFII